jgi:CRP-like cAMP-binding protein
MRRKPIDLKLETLRGIPGLERCSADDLLTLARYCDELQASAGTTLIREGRAGRTAFIVLEGRVDVRRSGVLLWEAGRGSLVGDLGVLGSMPAAATVVATAPLRYLCLDGRAADVIFGRNDLARWAYGQLEHRLRQITVAPAAYTPVLRRVADAVEAREPVTV